MELNYGLMSNTATPILDTDDDGEGEATWRKEQICIAPAKKQRTIREEVDHDEKSELQMMPRNARLTVAAALISCELMRGTGTGQICNRLYSKRSPEDMGKVKFQHQKVQVQ